MLAVPYATLGVVGFLIYRGCKKNAQYLQAFGQSPAVPPPMGERGV